MVEYRVDRQKSNSLSDPNSPIVFLKIASCIRLGFVWFGRFYFEDLQVKKGRYSVVFISSRKSPELYSEWVRQLGRPLRSDNIRIPRFSERTERIVCPRRAAQAWEEKEKRRLPECILGAGLTDCQSLFAPENRRRTQNSRFYRSGLDGSLALIYTRVEEKKKRKSPASCAEWAQRIC